MEYNKKIIELFHHPKNMGEMKNPDAIGEVGNPTCVLPEEKIFLNTEFKAIKNASKNNVILSHDSTKNKIVDKFSRNYDGKIILLKNNLGEISLTPEHLVFAIKLPKHYNYFRTRNKQKLIPAWYHAEQLEKRDLILYPIPKETEDLKFIDIDIPKRKYDFKSKKIPKKIPLSSDLLRLFGYFLAEGYISDKPSKTFISFAFNINENEFIKDVQKICKKIFGLEVKIKEFQKQNVCRVDLYSAHLARFFKTLFGNGAINKKIPDFIMNLPIQKQKSLIEGLWKGDGCININRKGPRAGYVTVSYQLVQQIKLLLLRQGIVPSIYLEKEKISKWANHKKAYRIHVGQRDSLKKICNILKMKYSPKSYESITSWFDEEFLYTPITKVEKMNYKGKVHNLEVEDTHSFISEAFCLHNCGDIMRIYLKIGDKKGKKFIKDIKFQTMGCIAAIATSSMVTELAKGKTLDEAKKITNKDVANSLGNLPPIKMHCSNLAADALKKAIENYKKG